MSFQDDLTLGSLRSELLLNISDEIKLELNPVNHNLKLLTDRGVQIEQSQCFLLENYDNLLEVVQTTRNHVPTHEPRVRQQDEEIHSYSTR